MSNVKVRDATVYVYVSGTGYTNDPLREGLGRIVRKENDASGSFFFPKVPSNFRREIPSQWNCPQEGEGNYTNSSSSVNVIFMARAKYGEGRTFSKHINSAEESPFSAEDLPFFLH